MAYSLDDTDNAILLVQQFEEDEKIARQLQSQFEAEFNLENQRNVGVTGNAYVPALPLQPTSTQAERVENSASGLPTGPRIASANTLINTAIPAGARNYQQRHNYQYDPIYPYHPTTDHSTGGVHFQPITGTATTVVSGRNFRFPCDQPLLMAATNNIQVQPPNPFATLHQRNNYLRAVDESRTNAVEDLRTIRQRPQEAHLNLAQQHAQRNVVSQNTIDDQNNAATATPPQTQRVAASPVAEGLNRSEINCLPSRFFNRKKNQIPADQLECLICLCDWKEREKLRILPCLHEFHSRCVDSWLKKNRTCPKCRCIVSLPTNDSDDNDFPK